MAESQAAVTTCDHHFECRILGGHPITVRVCTLCGKPDWADLNEQAAGLYRWGWQEGRDGKPLRGLLRAYEQPVPACTCTTAPAPAAHTGICAVNAGPAPDPITALLAHLEAEEAKARRTADDAGRRPADDLIAVEALYAAGGVACGLRIAAVLAVGHLRGADARDAYIAATEGARTAPDNPAASADTVYNDSVCDSYVSPTEPSESGCCARCGMYDWKHGGELARLRAEVARMQEAGDHHLRAAERERDEARMWARHGYEIGQRSCTWSDYGVAPAWLTEELPPPSAPPADDTPADAGQTDRAYWDQRDGDPE